MHVCMFTAYRYDQVSYACILPTVFCHSTLISWIPKNTNELIMQSLNEPNRGYDSNVKHIYYISAK